jgi:hypothetical protein
MSEPPPTTPNHCGKCGASAYPGANYCQNCGKSISLSDEPFDIEERLIDIYPTYMVTLISIIQAAALGYLLLAAKDQLSNAVTSAYDPIWTILIIGMFVMIVATWIQYSHAVLTLQLTPTTLGALVPFLFGVTQALAIFSINLQQSALFYFSMSFNALVGLSSYISMFREARLHQDRAANRLFLERAGTYPRNIERTTVARFAIFLSFGVTEALFKLNSLYLAIVVLVMNVMMLVVIHRNMNRMFFGY